MKVKITVFIMIAIFVAACGVGEAKFEPKVIIKEYVEALKAKDVEKIKETASAKTVKLFEDAAKQQNISLEEMIKKNEPQIAPMLENPEIRNEKVEGDKATVEVKNPADGNWNKLTFVKEDNRWKIGAGEMLEDLKNQIEKMKKEVETKEDAVNKETSNKQEEPEKK